MIYRIFPTKDTFVTNAAKIQIRRTGSNVGESETLEIFKLAGISGTIGTLGSSSLARTLIQFDTAAIALLTGSNDISPVATYRLVLKHKTSGERLPSSFDVTVVPVTTAWDEGTGIDDQRLTDLGVANWDKATSTTWWTTAGGDFNLSSTASMHFDSGREDLDVDITNIFRSWTNGVTANNGLIVKMSASHESDAVYSDFYTKKFYSRASSYEDRRPYIEISWNDFVADDRSSMFWSRSGTLVMQNIVQGILTNLSGNPIVDIKDLSGTLLSVTSSYTGNPGIYSASLALVSASYSGSMFSDCWRLSGNSLFTGSFSFGKDGGTDDGAPFQLVAKVRNLQNEYVADDVVRFDVSFRKRAQVQSVLSTASLTPSSYIVRKAYFSIENDATSEQVVPFGTGSTEYTKMSYDKNGNYFKFHMRNLHAGNVYRIVFLADERGYKQVIDSSFRFKVV